MDPKNLDILRALLTQAPEEKSKSARPPRSIQEKVPALKEALLTYLRPPSLQVGDIVVWKSGMKNKKRPEYNDPAIIVEVLDEPIIDKDESTASPYFREKLDVRLALLDEDSDFVFYHFDSHRFEKIEISAAIDGKKEIPAPSSDLRRRTSLALKKPRTSDL